MNKLRAIEMYKRNRIRKIVSIKRRRHGDASSRRFFICVQISIFFYFTPLLYTVSSHTNIQRHCPFTPTAYYIFSRCVSISVAIILHIFHLRIRFTLLPSMSHLVCPITLQHGHASSCPTTSLY